MKKKTHTFTANVDMNCSLDFHVKAKTVAEAKRKIFAQFKRKLKMADLDFDIDKEIE